MWFGGRTYRVPVRRRRTVNCRMPREGWGFLYHHTKDTGSSPVDWCPYKEPLYKKNLDIKVRSKLYSMQKVL
jgi:hypothetical protein